MEKRTFTNELGKNISIYVQKDEENQRAMLTMESKDSIVTNVITYLEASRLKEVLDAAGF